MTALKLARLSATTPATAALKLARLSATGTALAVPALKLARLSATGTASVRLNAIAAQTVEPGIWATVTAVLSDGGTADSYAFKVISGPTGTQLVVTGAVCKFISPAAMPPGGATVVIGVTATVGGVTSAEQQATVKVKPELQWTRVPGGQWVGAHRPPVTGLVLSTRNYPAATPLVNGNPWEQVQLPRVRGTVVPRINGITSSIPGTGAAPASAMKVELFAHSNNDVTSTALAGASEIDTVIQLNTAVVPVFAYDFLLNNRTNEKLRVAPSYTSGTTVPVIRATQGYAAATPIINGDTFRINGGDVSDSGGNYDTSRAEVRGDYASPSSTVPRLWPHPYNSVRFLNFKIMLPTGLFPTPTGTDWVVLTQWKGQYGGSPPVSLEAATGGTFKLQLGATTDVPFGALTRNVWHEITLGAFLSPDPALGWVEVWFNGTNVVPRMSVATMEYQSGTTTPDPVYLKQGIYKPKEWAADHTCYFGPLAIADSGAPFGAVL